MAAEGAPGGEGSGRAGRRQTLTSQGAVKPFSRRGSLRSAAAGAELSSPISHAGQGPRSVTASLPHPGSPCCGASCAHAGGRHPNPGCILEQGPWCGRLQCLRGRRELQLQKQRCRRSEPKQPALGADGPLHSDSFLLGPSGTRVLWARREGWPGGEVPWVRCGRGVH